MPFWFGPRIGRTVYELLDGVVFAISAERLRHARLKADVYSQFKRRIAEAGLSGEAMVDGMAVRVDEATVFEPDALVRCGPRLPDDVLSIDDPVIVVEVVSASSRRVDVLLKLTRYVRNPHIVHYLIVVPDDHPSSAWERRRDRHDELRRGHDHTGSTRLGVLDRRSVRRQRLTLILAP